MIAVVRLPMRPWSLNSERSEHWREHRRKTETAKESTQWILRSLHLPVLTRVHVIGLFDMVPPLADPGNNYGALKAMVDAVVKEHLLADDNANHVATVTMYAPSRATSTAAEGVTLILNDTDRKLVCEDCNVSVSDIIAADIHGGACNCALPHEGVDPTPTPKRRTAS